MWAKIAYLRPDEPLCLKAFSKLNTLLDGNVITCCHDHDIDGKIRSGNAIFEKIDKIYRGPDFSGLLQAF